VLSQQVLHEVSQPTSSKPNPDMTWICRWRCTIFQWWQWTVALPHRRRAPKWA